MHAKRLYLASAALLAALIACNAPNATQPSSPDAAFTAAAQTVAAHLTGEVETQAASVQVVTPTPAADTPVAASVTPSSPPATIVPPSSTPVCDQMAFVADVTIPDGTNEDAGVTFSKTWRIKNTGVCSWTSSYALVFVSGNSMNGPAAVPLSGSINPGDTVDLSVTLTAPATPGDASGTWRLRNASGKLFGLVTVNIHVNGSGLFAVTHVDFSTSTGGCGGFHAVAIITANGTGTVTYHWVRSDGAADSVTHAPLNFTGSGTQTVTDDWNTTASGDQWIDLYIDTPNHQEFSRASFTCP